MTAFNKERIQAALQPAEDGIWQALVDICYADWNREGNGDWGLEEMLTNARFSYGEVVEMACLLGSHYQQVCNGGHSQYLDNGYSGTPDKRHTYDYDVPLAQRLLELMDKFELSDTDYGKKVHDVVQDFIARTTNWMDSGTREMEWDEEDDDMPDYDDLDTAFYQVTEWWEHELKRYFQLWLEFGEDPITTGRF